MVESLGHHWIQGKGVDIYITICDMTRQDGLLLFNRLMSCNTNIE